MTNKTIIMDFSRVLIFAHDEVDSLNAHHKKLASELAAYYPLEHFRINGELLEWLKHARSHADIYLFSNGKLHELEEVESSIKGIFMQIFTAASIGYSKTDPAAYFELAKQIAVPPEEIIFVDDNIKNVNAALDAGTRAVQYENNTQVIRCLDELIARPGSLE